MIVFWNNFQRSRWWFRQLLGWVAHRSSFLGQLLAVNYGAQIRSLYRLLLGYLAIQLSLVEVLLIPLQIAVRVCREEESH